MAYTVKKLAQISGVSVRTLHFYDESGLLKPAYYGSNGYRYYEEKQLLLLQQILFYRNLGLEIKRIRKILGQSDFNILAALVSHREVLQKELERNKKAIETIDKTINHLKGIKKMKEEELFYGLDSPKQKEYEKYLIDTGKISGAEIEQSHDKCRHWSQEKWDKVKQDGDQLMKDFVAAIEKGLACSSEEVQKLVRRFYGSELIGTPNKEKFIGLTQLYQEHPDFHKFFDHYHPRLMDFVIEAMKIFAQRELS